MDHQDVKHYLTGLGVKWQFNLPKTLWWEGTLERLIHSVKRCLCKNIGQARLTQDELDGQLLWR